jgi:hypothetical protein
LASDVDWARHGVVSSDAVTVAVSLVSTRPPVCWAGLHAGTGDGGSVGGGVSARSGGARPAAAAAAAAAAADVDTDADADADGEADAAAAILSLRGAVAAAVTACCRQLAAQLAPGAQASLTVAPGVSAGTDTGAAQEKEAADATRSYGLAAFKLSVNAYSQPQPVSHHNCAAELNF